MADPVVHILVVEDEEAILRLIQYNLDAAGYAVRTQMDGAAALDDIEDNPPDLLVLDWMLPEVDGIEICEYIRESETHRHIPIIMLTARGEEEDRLRGLDAGADDYMVKPFSPKELVARIGAVLRRVRPSLARQVIEAGKLHADTERGKLSLKQGEKRVAVKCGPTEFRLACQLMEHAGHVQSRSQLLDAVWQDKELGYDSRTVDVHIRRLRKALDDAAAHAGDLIETVRGLGYRLEP